MKYTIVGILLFIAAACSSPPDSPKFNNLVIPDMDDEPDMMVEEMIPPVEPVEITVLAPVDEVYTRGEFEVGYSLIGSTNNLVMVSSGGEFTIPLAANLNRTEVEIPEFVPEGDYAVSLIAYDARDRIQGQAENAFVVRLLRTPMGIEAMNPQNLSISNASEFTIRFTQPLAAGAEGQIIVSTDPINLLAQQTPEVSADRREITYRFNITGHLVAHLPSTITDISGEPLDTRNEEGEPFRVSWVRIDWPAFGLLRPQNLPLNTEASRLRFVTADPPVIVWTSRAQPEWLSVPYTIHYREDLEVWDVSDPLLPAGETTHPNFGLVEDEGRARAYVISRLGESEYRLRTAIFHPTNGWQTEVLKSEAEMTRSFGIKAASVADYSCFAYDQGSPLSVEIHVACRLPDGTYHDLPLIAGQVQGFAPLAITSDEEWLYVLAADHLQAQQLGFIGQAFIYRYPLTDLGSAPDEDWEARSVRAEMDRAFVFGEIQYHLDGTTPYLYFTLKRQTGFPWSMHRMDLSQGFLTAEPQDLTWDLPPAVSHVSMHFFSFGSALYTFSHHRPANVHARLQLFGGGSFSSVLNVWSPLRNPRAMQSAGGTFTTGINVIDDRLCIAFTNPASHHPQVHCEPR